MANVNRAGRRVALGADPDPAITIWRAALETKAWAVTIRYLADGERISWADAESEAIVELRADRADLWEPYERAIEREDIQDAPDLGRTGFDLRPDDADPAPRAPRRRAPRRWPRGPARWPI